MGKTREQRLARLIIYTWSEAIDKHVEVRDLQLDVYRGELVEEAGDSAFCLSMRFRSFIGLSLRLLVLSFQVRSSSSSAATRCS